MRELPYKLELPYEYEYTISIPQGQSGRIKLETIEAYYLDTSDPGNYVVTITDICGFVQPDGYTSLELKKIIRESSERENGMAGTFPE